MKKILKLFVLLGIIVAVTGIYSFTNKTPAPIPTVISVAITVTDNSQYECARNVTLTYEINGMKIGVSQQYVSGTTLYTFTGIPADCDKISSGMSKKCSQNETILGQSKNGPFTPFTTQTLGVGISS